MTKGFRYFVMFGPSALLCLVEPSAIIWLVMAYFTVRISQALKEIDNAYDRLERDHFVDDSNLANGRVGTPQ